MWRHLESAKLEWSWCYDDLCTRLEDLTFKRSASRSLLFNMPPRHLKSTFAGAAWPAFEWLIDPTIRYLSASYDDTLSTRDALRSRRLMETVAYKRLKARLGVEWEFSSDQNVKSYYENDQGGSRMAIGVRGKATGFGGERLLGDDLHHTREADNPDALKAVCDWWDQVYDSRVNDPRTAVRVVLGQRVGSGDISDHLERAGFTKIVYPFLFEAKKAQPHDPRDVEGEPLVPERWGPDEVATVKRKRRVWRVQWQQDPEAREGKIFKRHDFKRYSALPVRFDEEVISADFTFKGKSVGDEMAKVLELSYVSIDVWGFLSGDAYLIDQDRGQWDFLRALQRFVAVCVRHPRATRKLIEDKANGSAIMSILRRDIPGLIEVEPQGSKVQRAYACQPFVESGNIWVPYTDWVDDPDDGWLKEVCQFPEPGEPDDRVDSMTQVLIERFVNEGANALDTYKRLTAR